MSSFGDSTEASYNTLPLEFDSKRVYIDQRFQNLELNVRHNSIKISTIAPVAYYLGSLIRINNSLIVQAFTTAKDGGSCYYGSYTD